MTHPLMLEKQIYFRSHVQSLVGSRTFDTKAEGSLLSSLPDLILAIEIVFWGMGHYPNLAMVGRV